MATTKVGRSSKLSDWAVYEIKWLENRLEELREYIDARPLAKLEDRQGERITKWGTQSYTVATIEVQRKDITDAIKQYAEISEIVARMRMDQDQNETAIRGGGKLSAIDKGLLDDDDDDK